VLVDVLKNGLHCACKFRTHAGDTQAEIALRLARALNGGTPDRIAPLASNTLAAGKKIE
jgi:hypothetical protein